MGKRIFFHAFCLAAFAAGAPLAAQAQTPAAPPAVISVTGEAHISVPPDLVQIDAGVTSEAKTAREASDANNTAMGKVLLALKGAGIDEKDYQTSRLSLQAQNSVARPGASPIITGYRASNRVTIRLRDVDQGCQCHRYAGHGRRQRHRRHQFHGVAGIETARRCA